MTSLSLQTKYSVSAYFTTGATKECGLGLAPARGVDRLLNPDPCPRKPVSGFSRSWFLGHGRSHMTTPLLGSFITSLL